MELHRGIWDSVKAFVHSAGSSRFNSRKRLAPTSHWKISTSRIMMIAALLLFSSAIFALPTIPTTHASAQTNVPSITLSQSSGPSGAIITVSGSGFGYENDLYSIEICCSYLGSLPVPSAPYYCSPNGAGSFSCEYGILDTNSEYFCVVPTVLKQIECIINAAQGALPFPPGQYTVEVHSEVSIGIKSIPTQSASAPFTITGGPAVTLSKTSGPWGTTVTARGSGFNPTDGYVGLYLESLSSTTGFSFSAPCSFGGSCFVQTTPTYIQSLQTQDGYGCVMSGGAFSNCTFKIPNGAPAAPYFVTAVGDDTGGADNCGGCDTGQALFAVEAAITLTPASGPVGSTVTVAGTGFGYYTGSLTSQTYVSDYSVIGTEDGLLFGGCDTAVSNFQFSCTFSVPAFYSNGPHTITECGAQGECASAILTQTVAGYSLNPTSGPAGSIVTVTGSGFSPSDNYISIDLSGQHVDATGGGSSTSCVPSQGSFTCTFRVPQNAQLGPGYVDAVGASGDTIQNFFSPQFYVTYPTLTIYDPSVSDAPVSTVKAGESLTALAFEGGWSYNDNMIALALGGDTVATCPFTYYWSCTFTVPNLSPGQYTFTASGTDGDSISQTLTIIPSISLSPSFGPSGTSVTVTGSGFSTQDTSATIDFGSTDVTSCPVAVPNGESIGTLSCTISVPSDSPGRYTVTVSGNSGGSYDVGKSTFSLTVPTIVATPASSPSGVSVTVDGSGFSGSDTSVILTLGTTTSLPCPVSGGSFSCDISTPPSLVTPTSLTLTAKGNGGDSASVPFTLTEATAALSDYVGGGSAYLGPAGLDVAVTFSGLPSSDTSISVSFNSQQLSGSCPLQNGANDPSEGCSFVVPSLSIGTYPVCFTDYPSSFTLCESFTITHPSFSVSPSEGPAGMTITLSGSGYPGSTVLPEITGGGSSGTIFPLGTTGCPVTDGSFSCSFSTASYATGTYSVQSGLAGLCGVFPCGDPSSSLVVTMPAIVLSPTQGPPGTEVTVNGTGFSGLDTTATINLGSTDVTPTAGCPVSAGSFSCSFTLPLSTGAGSYTISATGITGDFASSLFTATTPRVSLSQTFVTVGTQVNIVGEGFVSTDTSINLAIGSLDLIPSSRCTPADGSFDCTFLVPSSLPANGYNVVATGTALDSASTTLEVINPLVSVSPATGQASGSINVKGLGFSPLDSSAQVYLAQSDVTPVSGCPVSGGSLDCSITIPYTASPGSYPLTVTGNSGDRGFTSISIAPLITAGPSSGSVGETVTLSGQSFSQSDTYVSLHFGGVALNPSTCPVSAGSFGCSFQVPPIASGVYTVAAIGSSQAGNDQAFTTFTVHNEYLSLTQNAGPPGTLVGVFGTDFPSIVSSSTISLGSTIVNSNCPIAGRSAADEIAQPGSLSCIFTVPELPVGTYTLTVNDPSLGVASIPFTVTDPSLTMSLSPISGPQGIQVDLTASPFPSGDSTAQILFGTQVLNSACPVASGTASCSFIVPSLSSGTYTVTAKDPFGNAAVAKFTLTIPTISVVPASAPAGSDIGVFGSGFSSTDSSVDILIGGTDVTSSAQCSFSEGFFSCQAVVPKLSSGSYTITATGEGSSDSASTPFSVTITTISLSTSTGQAGSVVTIEGSGFPATSSYATVSFGVSQVVALSESGTSSCPIASDGTISTCSFTVPTVAFGPYTVTLSDFFGDTAAATFTILPPAISLSSPSGTAGSQLQVTGLDFSLADTSVTLTLGAVTVTPSTGCLVKGGSFSCTIALPDSSEGSNTITAAGEPGGDSASAPIAVMTTTSISSLLCSPSIGTVGTAESCTALVMNGDSTYATSPGGTIIFSGTLPPGMPTSCFIPSQSGAYSSSICQVTWTPAAGTAGSYSIEAAYQGDATHEPTPMSAVTTLTVQKSESTSSVSCSPNPATIDTPTTCTATVTGYQPVGTVTFGSSSSTGVFSPAECTLNAVGTCTVSFLDTTASTINTITITYLGDLNNIGSSGSTSLNVQYINCAAIVPNEGGANLKGADLEYCNLAGYNMAGDNLMGANMQFTDLQSASLQGSNMQGVNLADTLAQGANFQGANLKGAILYGAVLTGVDMQGANLMNADLSGASAEGVNFQGDNLMKTNLSNGDFANSQFQGSNLKDSNMSYGNFSYANFTGANTNGANTTGANFDHAIDPPR